MLSKRMNALSKWNEANGSEDKRSTNEMFFQSVPAVHRSMPERSNPWPVTCRETWEEGSPGVASTGWLFVVSRCHCGVMRNVIGRYEGFCRMGESRSFIN